MSDSRNFARNEVSKRKRPFAMYPVDYLTVESALSLVQILHAANLQLITLTGALNPMLQALIIDCFDVLLTLTRYDVDSTRRKLTKKLTSIASAEFWFRSPREFAHQFIFSADELRVLVPLLAPFKLNIHKKGSMDGEEAVLLVLARLRAVEHTFEGLEIYFGRNESTLSRFFREAIKFLYGYHQFRLDIRNLHRYRILAQDDATAFLLKYQEKFPHVQALPNRFANCGWVMDGCRQDIDEPSVFGDEYYSNYSHSFNQLTLGIASATGIVVGLAQFCVGKHADGHIVIADNVNYHLSQVPVKVLCDKAFGLDTHVAPLPRSNQNVPVTPQEIQKICGIRVAIEWCFGELFQQFPYLVDHYKQKVFQTSPSTVFTVGVLLVNCMKCFRGCNATTYFNRMPMDIFVYLGP